MSEYHVHVYVHVGPKEGGGGGGETVTQMTCTHPDMHVMVPKHPCDFHRPSIDINVADKIQCTCTGRPHTARSQQVHGNV